MKVILIDQNGTVFSLNKKPEAKEEAVIRFAEEAVMFMGYQKSTVLANDGTILMEMES